MKSSAVFDVFAIIDSLTQTKLFVVISVKGLKFRGKVSSFRASETSVWIKEQKGSEVWLQMNNTGRINYCVFKAKNLKERSSLFLNYV